MLALLFAVVAVAQPPSPLSVYTYSRDSDAGFQDELLDVFRRELLKHVASFTEVAYDAESAHASVQLLGQGELTVELGARDEPVRYLFEEDEKAERMWALVRIGSFSKEFSLAGSGTRDLSRLAKKVGDWLAANRQAIREHHLESSAGELPQGAASRSPRPQLEEDGGSADEGPDRR